MPMDEDVTHIFERDTHKTKTAVSKENTAYILNKHIDAALSLCPHVETGHSIPL